MKRLIGLASLALAACGPVFASEDVTAIEGQVREHYSSQGATVTNISFVETAEGRLSGFAKVTDNTSGMEFTHDCSADMAADKQNYVWKCDAS